MGYFSNGTEGMDYQDRYCARCVHNEDDPDKPGCPVWGAHLFYNRDQAENVAVKGILDSLIPVDGLRNGECRMFRAKQPEGHVLRCLECSAKATVQS